MKRDKSTRSQVLEAINAMDRRVTIPDVVTRTGLALNTVATTLNDIAYETRANLEVTSGGVIFYNFPDNLNYLYLSSRLTRLLRTAWGKTFPVLHFLFQISFGLALIFSIAVIFFVMLVIQVLLSVLSGHTSGVGETFKEYFFLMKRLGVLNIIRLPDLLRDPSNNGKSAPKNEDDQDRGFLLNCYEFLFGPGDPNEKFAEERSQSIARMIRANNGIILPEQLSPFTGLSMDEPEGDFQVLSKFQGFPATTRSGHLVYVFSQMRGGTIDPESIDTDTKLVKRAWKFTEASKEAMKPVMLMALFNFMGTLFFWWTLFAARTTSHRLEATMLILALYGSFFLFFPLLRWLAVHVRNAGITTYNKKINHLEQIVTCPDPELVARMKEAEQMRLEAVENMDDRLVYTTSRDYVEQEGEALDRLLDGDSDQLP